MIDRPVASIHSISTINSITFNKAFFSVIFPLLLLLLLFPFFFSHVPARSLTLHCFASRYGGCQMHLHYFLSLLLPLLLSLASNILFWISFGSAQDNNDVGKKHQKYTTNNNGRENRTRNKLESCTITIAQSCFFLMHCESFVLSLAIASQNVCVCMSICFSPRSLSLCVRQPSARVFRRDKHTKE